MDQDTEDSGAFTRREALRGGARLAFTAPLVSTFFANQAYAANYSCYGLGHLCEDIETDPEPCCAGLQCTGPPPKTCK